jgi:tetratricopeptide (TPR) repeat protein
VGLLAAPIVLALMNLLGAAAALAQGTDDGTGQPPPPPAPDPNADWKTWLVQNAHYAWGTWEGRLVLGLVLALTLVRIFYMTRSKIERSAKSGEGAFGVYFAQKNLEKLEASGQHEAAAELLLTLGKGNTAGPPGDPTREIEAAEQFLKARRFVRAAELFVKKGRPKRAAEAYERAGTFDLAAELFEKAGDLERAEENYLKAKNKPAVARMWSQAGNSQKAAAYFSEISRPKEAAEHLEKLGKKPEALEKYIEAFALLSSGASRDKTRGGERDIGVEHESKELFAKICKLYDELKDWEHYAAFLLKQNRHDAAAEVYRKAGDLPKAAELLREGRHWDAAGRLLEELGRHQEALVLFAQARQDRGEVEKAAELYIEAGEYRIAAENYEQLGKTAAAAEIYEKQNDPQRAADLYAKIGDYKKAGLLYEQTKQWNAAVFCWEQQGELVRVGICWEHAGNHFLAGVTFFTSREVNRAIEALKKVEAGSEDRREAARLLGILLHESGRDKESLPYFEEGFGRKIEKDDVEAFYYYAQTLEHIHAEIPKAISAYETIEKLKPNYRDTHKRLDACKGGKPLPKTSIYADGQDDPGSLFHTSRFSLRASSERGRPTEAMKKPDGHSPKA